MLRIIVRGILFGATMLFCPVRQTEPNVQAEFYHQCKLTGLPCFLSYRSLWSGPAPNDAHFDAVIHDDREIWAVVEFKRGWKDARRRCRWANSRQCVKYKAYGVPVFLVTCPDEIQPVIAKLRQMQQERGAHGTRA